jgi:putative transposase
MAESQAQVCELTRRVCPMARRKEPKIPNAILDQLLGVDDPKTAFDPNGLLNDLKKALAERALNAETDPHLADGEAGNSRNGYRKKTVVTDTARIELDLPRDRRSGFDPHLIAKYQRRFPGLDEKIISMYARGMSARDRRTLRDLYGVDVSPDLISAVTDAVLDEVAAWQGRPLEAVSPWGPRAGWRSLDRTATERGHGSRPRPDRRSLPRKP